MENTGTCKSELPFASQGLVVCQTCLACPGSDRSADGTWIQEPELRMMVIGRNKRDNKIQVA